MFLPESNEQENEEVLSWSQYESIGNGVVWKVNLLKTGSPVNFIVLASLRHLLLQSLSFPTKASSQVDGFVSNTGDDGH